MEERVGERRSVLVVSLLGPLPARSSRGEDGEIDAALKLRTSLKLGLKLGLAILWQIPHPR
jgi:hypothetical protein